MSKNCHCPSCGTLLPTITHDEAQDFIESEILNKQKPSSL